MKPEKMVTTYEKDQPDEFEEVMEHVGTSGIFQKRFNLVFNMMFSFMFAMPCFNILLALTVPDHWCHVPGRPAANFTMEEWKQLTIPKLVNTE